LRGGPRENPNKKDFVWQAVVKTKNYVRRKVLGRVSHCLVSVDRGAVYQSQGLTKKAYQNEKVGGGGTMGLQG